MTSDLSLSRRRFSAGLYGQNLTDELYKTDAQVIFPRKSGRGYAALRSASAGLM